MKDRYVIASSVIPISEKLEHELRLQAKQALPIFNYNEHSTDDQLRLQTKPKSTKEFARFVDHLYGILYEEDLLTKDHIISDWVIIVSKKGCQEQHMHTDYAPTLSVSDHEKPLSIIIGLEKTSSILVLCDDDTTQRIEFGKGQIFAFRGDVVHAGDRYDEENIRLHCYVDTTKVKRLRNKTYLKGEDF
jgi:hypothetical protein